MLEVPYACRLAAVVALQLGKTYAQIKVVLLKDTY
jgi:hypothetical protein